VGGGPGGNNPIPNPMLTHNPPAPPVAPIPSNVTSASIEVPHQIDVIDNSSVEPGMQYNPSNVNLIDRLAESNNTAPNYEGPGPSEASTSAPTRTTKSLSPTDSLPKEVVEEVEHLFHKPDTSIESSVSPLRPSEPVASTSNVERPESPPIIRPASPTGSTDSSETIMPGAYTTSEGNTRIILPRNE